MPYYYGMTSSVELKTVAKEMKKRGVTRKWMAEQIGVSPDHFYRYLSGKRSLGISAKTLLFQKLELSEAPARAS
jgi:predicted transcriptional regulator